MDIIRYYLYYFLILQFYTNSSPKAFQELNMQIP